MSGKPLPGVSRSRPSCLANNVHGALEKAGAIFVAGNAKQGCQPMHPETALSFFVTEHPIEQANDASIAADVAMRLDFEAINRALFTIDRMIATADWKSHEELTILRLGVRIFNDAGACLKAARAGYYQPALAQVRDIMETSYLLDYFKQSPGKIALWVSTKASQKHFKPGAVRKALEKTDTKMMRRGEAYSTCCEYASHPTPQGFAVISSPDMMTRMGPFADAPRVAAVLFDLSVYLVCATLSFGGHVNSKQSVDGIRTELLFMESVLPWAKQRLPELHDSMASDLSVYRGKSTTL